MAVRSISASISACAARIAPRTISSVTGSQAPGTEFLPQSRGAFVRSFMRASVMVLTIAAKIRKKAGDTGLPVSAIR